MKSTGGLSPQLLMGDTAAVTIACQQRGCSWEIENFLSSNQTVIVHPLIAAYTTHHLLEAHHETITRLIGGTVNAPEASAIETNVRMTFTAHGVNPDDPYEHMELVWE